MISTLKTEETLISVLQLFICVNKTVISLHQSLESGLSCIFQVCSSLLHIFLIQESILPKYLTELEKLNSIEAFS